VLNFDGTGRQSVACPVGSFFSGISGEQAATTPLESIPAYVEGMKKKLSPYDLPQSNDNPMRPLLAGVIDFDRLRLQEEIQLTVSAPTPAPQDGASSPIGTSRSTLCWPQRACRSFFALWRLTASHIGTALSRETCQRRSKNASAGRSKSTSAKLVRRPAELGALGLGIRLGSDYPPAYPSWQGVGVACSD
jgi:hypothetical protein